MTDVSNGGNNNGTLPLDDESTDRRTIDADTIEAIHAQMENEGIRLDSVVTPRTFVASQQEAANIVHGKPRGWNLPIGLIAGMATSCERRENKQKFTGADGKEIGPSLWIKGEFEVTVLYSGDGVVGDEPNVRASRWLILPRGSADLIEEAFAQPGVERIMLDVELGIEATGKGIPYMYTVTARGLGDNENRRAARAIRARQHQRLAQRKQAQLADQRFGQPHHGHGDPKLIEGKATSGK